MKKLAMLVSIAAMGFALGANAHDGPVAGITHGWEGDCKSKVSGGYYEDALNIAHGEDSELDDISVQGKVTWKNWEPSRAECGGSSGLVFRSKQMIPIGRI